MEKLMQAPMETPADNAPLEGEPRMIVVKRALVNIKLEKPAVLSDERFDELIDNIYVDISECLDARAINDRVRTLLSGMGLDFAIEVEVV